MANRELPFSYDVKAKHIKNRRLKRWRTFFRYNFLLPSFFATLALVVFSSLIQGNFPNLMFLEKFLWHFAFLLLLLTLQWIPIFVIAWSESETARRILVLIRNLVIVGLLLLLFPYQLLHYMTERFSLRDIILTIFIIGFITLLIGNIFISQYSHIDIKKFLPHSRKKLRTIYESLTYLNLITVMLLVEFWFTAYFTHPESKLWRAFNASSNMISTVVFHPEDQTYETGNFVVPYESIFYHWSTAENEQGVSIIQSHPTTYKEMSTSERKHLQGNFVAWLCTALLTVFIFLVFGGSSMRILAAVLPTAFHQLPKLGLPVEEIIINAHNYNNSFRDSVIKEYPFRVMGGFIGTFINLSIPIFLKVIGRDDLLTFFGVALIAAWLGPVIISLNEIDQVFSRYFYRTLGNLINEIQNHVVYVGYGNLGKRVVDKDVRRSYMLDHERNIIEVVNPDLTVIRIYTSGVVIDVSDKEFVYAAYDDLLDRYGVVRIPRVGGMRLDKAPVRGITGTKGPGSKWQYSVEKDVLVPALRGDIADPLIPPGLTWKEPGSSSAHCLSITPPRTPSIWLPMRKRGRSFVSPTAIKCHFSLIAPAFSLSC